MAEVTKTGFTTIKTMNIEDIKVGKTYMLPFEVIKINDTDIHMRNGGVKGIFQPEELMKISHEPEPKYDPCRKFKAGDKVRVVENKGRKQACSGSLATVKQDEDENKVLITIDGSGIWWVDAAYLELVTPVEELERYSVVDAHTHWDVADKDMKCVATYSKLHHPNAKASAEAECARLNAEYGKEMEK